MSAEFNNYIHSMITSVRKTFAVALIYSASLGLGFVANASAQSVEESQRVARGLSVAFEEAAKIITPSVVNVSSTVKAKAARVRGRPGSPEGVEPFRDFFGDDLFDRLFPDQGQGGAPAQQGLGTGVIIDDAGHILTNNHVVGEADDISVRLQDGRTFKAQVIGKDSRTDLAVIKIKATGLTPAKLGESDNLKIGEWVVAAGNPFGLDNTITAGIVSAKGRAIMGGNQYEDFIQTDAAINPGNSGGPLVNLDGEVVGINTAIFSRSGGYMGIGFAIPISMARNVMQSLIAKGKVVRGWLGVGIQNLSEDLAKSFKHSSTEGALVGQVQEDGPAVKAGVKQGDIIVELNGEKIRNSNQLRNLVATLTPGTTANLKLIRDGKSQDVSVKIGELPQQISEEETEVTGDEEASASDVLGAKLQNLTPELAKRLHSKQARGVLVQALKPDGLGALAGLQPSDIIISVNGKRVGSVSDLKELLSPQALAAGVRMIVETQGMERFVFLKNEG
ncbi:MAG: DegQ family serine endoprotease [Oligoflexia bacterium]|nr:DegQ family serine endoprotease [Oligoflexia bacterium]